jgi:hypothetical protein
MARRKAPRRGSTTRATVHTVELRDPESQRAIKAAMRAVAAQWGREYARETAARLERKGPNLNTER